MSGETQLATLWQPVPNGHYRGSDPQTVSTPQPETSPPQWSNAYWAAKAEARRERLR